MLTELQKKVKEELPLSNIFEFHPLEWRNGLRPESDPEHEEYLSWFLSSFETAMKERITSSVMKRNQSIQNTPPLLFEIARHSNRALSLARSFKGRESFVSEFLDKLGLREREKMPNSPIIIHGPSGCGKTSMMAKISQNLVNQKENCVVVRFLGTSPSSSNLRDLLTSLISQINLIYHGRDPLKEAGPLSLPELLSRFTMSLDLPSPEKRLFIFLDSLDQLSPEDQVHQMLWIPQILPSSSVFLVLSSIPDTFRCLENLKKRLPEGTFLSLSAFERKECMEVSRTLLAQAGRRLIPQQEALLEEAFESCQLPLYVRLVSEESSLWASYLSPSPLKPSVEEMIESLFERLERKHPKILVTRSLALLTLAEAHGQGLAEEELEDILSLDEVTLNTVFQYWVPPIRRLPSILWRRIRQDFGGFLVERMNCGRETLAWFHRQFFEAAKQRYLGKELEERELASLCADYFLGTYAGGKEKPYKYPSEAKEEQAPRFVPAQPLEFSEGYPNLAKLGSLPLYLIHSLRWDALEQEVLFHLPFLQGKLEGFSVRELIADVQLAFDSMPSEEKGLALLLKEETLLLLRALRLSASPLSEDRGQLDFQLAGRLYFTSLRKESFPRLARLVDQAIESLKKREALSPVNQVFLPPECETGLFFSLSTELSKREWIMGEGSFLVTPRGSKLVLWELENGTQLRSLPFQREASYFFSPDGNLLAELDREGLLSFWSFWEEKKVFEFELVSELRELTFVPKLQMVLIVTKKQPSYIQILSCDTNQWTISPFFELEGTVTSITTLVPSSNSPAAILLAVKEKGLCRLGLPEKAFKVVVPLSQDQSIDSIIPLCDNTQVFVQKRKSPSLILDLREEGKVQWKGLASNYLTFVSPGGRWMACLRDGLFVVEDLANPSSGPVYQEEMHGLDMVILRRNCFSACENFLLFGRGDPIKLSVLALKTQEVLPCPLPLPLLVDFWVGKVHGETTFFFLEKRSLRVIPSSALFLAKPISDVIYHPPGKVRVTIISSSQIMTSPLATTHGDLKNIHGLPRGTGAMFWDLSSARLLHSRKGPIYSAAVSSPLRTLVYADSKNLFSLDLETLEESPLQFPSVPISECMNYLPVHCTFAKDGKYLATLNANYDLRIWDAEHRVPVINTIPMSISQLFFSDGNVLVGFFLQKRMISGFSNGLLLYDMNTSAKVVIREHKEGVRCASLSPDHRFVLSGDGEGNVLISNLRFLRRERLLVPRGGKGSPVLALALSPEGHYLACTHENQTLSLWNPQTSHLLRDIQLDYGVLSNITFGKGESTLYLARKHEGSLISLDVNSFKPKASFFLFQPVFSFSRALDDGSFLVSTNEGRVFLLNSNGSSFFFLLPPSSFLLRPPFFLLFFFLPSFFSLLSSLLSSFPSSI